MALSKVLIRLWPVVAAVLAVAGMTITPPRAEATATQNNVLHILPAPGPVKINGSTKDCDLSGGVFVCSNLPAGFSGLGRPVWLISPTVEPRWMKKNDGPMACCHGKTDSGNKILAGSKGVQSGHARGGIGGHGFCEAGLPGCGVAWRVRRVDQNS